MKLDIHAIRSLSEMLQCGTCSIGTSEARTLYREIVKTSPELRGETLATALDHVAWELENGEFHYDLDVVMPIVHAAIDSIPADLP